VACAPASASGAELRIAFGSCSEHDRPQPIWDAILASEPDLFFWVGDAVYGDTTDMALLRAKYAAQRAQPGYARLRARIPVFGTWDDHDYGANVGNREYPKRAESQQAFLDFLDVDAADPRRAREGVYGAQRLRAGALRVLLILLDVRYHREPAGRSDAAMLGESQWRWLEALLAAGDADLAIVATGTQVLPDEHLAEKWADHPDEQQRLYRALGAAPMPLLLASGDRHFGELSCDSWTPARRPLYEITSSGLTRRSDPGRDPNRRRVGAPVAERNFGVIAVDGARASLRLELRDAAGALRAERGLALGELAPRARAGRLWQWARRGGCGAAGDLPGAFARLPAPLWLALLAAALALPLLLRRAR